MDVRSNKEICMSDEERLQEQINKLTRENHGLQFQIEGLQQERDLYADEDRRVTEIALQRKVRIKELEKELEEAKDGLMKLSINSISFIKQLGEISKDYFELRKMRKQIQKNKFCEKCKQKFQSGQKVIGFIMSFCGEECRDIHLKELGWNVDETGLWTGGKLK